LRTLIFAQNNMAAVSAEGSRVWVLIRRLNASCNHSIAFVVRTLFHWLGGKRVIMSLISAWRSGEQIAVLMNGYSAAPQRHPTPRRPLSESWRPIDDEERRPPQATLDQIIENGTPGFGGFAAHALDPEHQLLAVLAHADDDQQGDRSDSGWRATGICSSVRSWPASVWSLCAARACVTAETERSARLSALAKT
jgi:hypothetical protein